MAAPIACTIVSNNYLPQARVFARSFTEHNPAGKVYTLIVDRPHPGLDYDAEPFEVVFAEQLPIPAFTNFVCRYSILELNTAVKPYFLEYLDREEGVEQLCYFDPDILVTAGLSELYRLVAGSDVVLTPHILEPLEDEHSPGQRDFLISGSYNLGFLGLAFNPATRPFVAWWQRRLYQECLHEVERGLFVDQKWMDLAPSFLDRARVLRDPGYNAAYWNLAHRQLARRDGRYLVNGEAPLRFFHFSGFDPRRPRVVSKYQDRIELDDRPDLEPIFTLYARRLEEEGFAELFPLPYGFGSFSDGTPIPLVARQLLRGVDPEGERWSDPFAVGPGSFFEWLLQPADEGALVPRIALGLWERRRDLESAFPQPATADGERFARWYAGGGAVEAGFPEAFIAPAAAALARLDAAPQETVATGDEGSGPAAEAAAAGEGSDGPGTPAATAAAGAQTEPWTAAETDGGGNQLAPSTAEASAAPEAGGAAPPATDDDRLTAPGPGSGNAAASPASPPPAAAGTGAGEAAGAAGLDAAVSPEATTDGSSQQQARPATPQPPMPAAGAQSAGDAATAAHGTPPHPERGDRAASTGVRRKAADGGDLLAALVPTSGGGSRPHPALAELADEERRWLATEAGAGADGEPRIPQLAMMIHRRRPDLAQQFPQPLAASRAAFARWYVTYGRLEYSLPANLVEPVLATLPAAQRLKARLWWWRHRRRRSPLAC